MNRKWMIQWASNNDARRQDRHWMVVQLQGLEASVEDDLDGFTAVLEHNYPGMQRRGDGRARTKIVSG